MRYRITTGVVSLALARWLMKSTSCWSCLCVHAALARAAGRDPPTTDEAAAAEAAGHRPRVVAGRRDNIKITWPGDLALAEAILARQAQEEGT